MDNPKICIHGVDGQEVDKYTADIELSNMCRNVYVARLKAAETVRKKVLDSAISDSCEDLSNNPDGLTNRPFKHRKTSIDHAMALLKREMASLIDQDLTLMKQLLTLNEQIEELKWRRRYCSYSRGSLASSANFGSSAGTLSDMELDNTDMSYRKFAAVPSPLSRFRGDNRSNSMDVLRSVKSMSGSDKLSSSVPGVGNISSSTSNINIPHSSKDYRYRNASSFNDNSSLIPSDSTTQLSQQLDNLRISREIANNNNNVFEKGSEYKIFHGEQQSFDSGIHEPELVFDIDMNQTTETTKL